MDELIRNLAVYALPVLFAITMHDAAQAFVAKRFGDNTAHAAGRTTFNPLAHIDPIGTILIPVVMYLMSGFVFGYAKPLPINYGQMRHPKRDMAWVALSGPGANFLMALIWTLMIYALAIGGVEEEFFMLMAKAGVLTNLVMFAFNLFPIPPLDGGRILTSLLPNRYAYKFAQIEPYGFFIVMALVLLKVIYTWWMAPVMYLAGSLLQLIVSPISFFF